MRPINYASNQITKNILRTALPLLAAQLFQLLYNVMDRIFIARIPGVGTAALGGVGLCFPIITMIAAFTNLYGAGGMPLFSIERGKGNDEEASKLMNTSFSLLLFTAGILMIVGFLFGEPILRALGASDAALVYSLPYLRIYLLGTAFTMIASGMNPFINAQGFPGVGMFTVIIGAAVNLVLDPVFIFALGMGVRGAAIATVIAQGFSAAFALRFLFGRTITIRLGLFSFREFWRNWKRAWEVVSLGISSFVMMFTNSLVQMSCNSVLAAQGGDLYVSVMTIISSVRQMLDLPVFAISEGATPTLSFNYGAKKPQHVRTAMKVMAVLGIIYTLAIWAVISWKPVPFIRIFTSDSTILADAVHSMRLYFFAFPFMTLQYCGQTTFKALKKRKKAVFFSIFRKVVIVVPLTFLLPYVFGMGTDGVFMAEPVSNVIGGAACFITMLLTVLPELREMERA